ncbi:hypothetical protein ACOME3_009846 [Neoechinorhynchus agilis]
MDADSFRFALTMVAETIIKYRNSNKDGIQDATDVTPSSTDIRPGYLKGVLGGEVPDTPVPIVDVLKQFSDFVLPGSVNWQHSLFFAYFPSGACFASLIGDLLANGLGNVAFSWQCSPMSVELELTVLEWLRRAFGLCDSFSIEKGGMNLQLCNPGQNVLPSLPRPIILMANFIKFWQKFLNTCSVADLMVLEHDFSNSFLKTENLWLKHPVSRQFVVYVSELSHSCIRKAVKILNLTRSYDANKPIIIRTLDVDDISLGLTRREAVETAILGDISVGREPLMIYATLGTTPVCSNDSIPMLSSLAKSYSLWLHVDASYSGAALLNPGNINKVLNINVICICPEMRRFLAQSETDLSFGQCDSITVNPYKWLLTGLGCCCLWTKHAVHLKAAMSISDVSYLRPGCSDEFCDMRDYGLMLSRPSKAIKVWMVLSTYGLTGLRSHIRRTVMLAKYMALRIKTQGKDHDLFLVNEPQTGLVCFRMSDNKRTGLLVRFLNVSHKIYLTSCEIKSRRIIRLCVGAEYSNLKHIDQAWDLIRKYADGVIEGLENERWTEEDVEYELHSPDCYWCPLKVHID